MKIVILRPGEHKNNILTSLGRQQVELICNQLKEYNFSAVFSSPAGRCIQTADIVCRNLNLNYHIKNELDERWQLGHNPVNNEEKLWWDNYLNCNHKTSLKEDCCDYIARTNTVLDQIKQDNVADSNILIIGHSSTSYAILNYIIKNNTNIIWQRLGNACFVCYEI